jgi:hypothetical protein
MSQVAYSLTYNEREDRVSERGKMRGDLVFTETLNCGFHECEFALLSEMEI